MEEFFIVERTHFLDNAPTEIGRFSLYEEAFDCIAKDRKEAEEVGAIGYLWTVRHILDAARVWEVVKIESLDSFGWIAEVGFSNGYGGLWVMWLDGEFYLMNSNNFSKYDDMREWKGISRELFQALCKERGIAMPFEL